MARILVIEDEPGTQVLLKGRLQDLGHEVVAAPNGAMGLMEARAQSFDLFLVDIYLGSGIDGYEVCRRLKAIPQTRNVPVVLVSGQVSSRDELHRGYEAGCEAYLIKGDLTLLEDVVRAMLRHKTLQDEMAMQNRLLEEQNRRFNEEQARGAELEDALRQKENPESAFRDHSAGRPDGVLIVDAEGIVRFADRGARDLLAKDLEGRNLGSLAPATGLEAFVRDARTEPRESFQIDLNLRQGHMMRTVNAAVMPMAPQTGDSRRPLRVVLLRDQGRRRVGAEMLRFEESSVPRRELGPLLEAARRVYRVSCLSGGSEVMTKLRSDVAREAVGRRSVLVQGESGSGRCTVARALHYGGDRSGPFLPIDCRSIARDAMESELFGYVKDAFPGATSDRPGLFQCAHLGTVCLESFEALPLELQAKVHRAVTRGEVIRIGGKRVENVDVRLIAITSVDFDKAKEGGTFDEGLVEELSHVELLVPPLRERPEDVPLLASEMVQRFSPGEDRLTPTDDVLWVLSQYDWPENIRELEGVLEHACLVATGAEITGDCLPQPLSDLFRRFELRDQIPAMPRRGGPASLPAVAPGAPYTSAGIDAALEDEPVSLELYEKRALERALRETGGDKLAAAKLLGVGKSTLYRKLKRYDIT